MSSFVHKNSSVFDRPHYNTVTGHTCVPLFAFILLRYMAEELKHKVRVCKSMEIYSKMDQECTPNVHDILYNQIKLHKPKYLK